MSVIIIWFNRKSLGEGCQLLKCSKALHKVFRSVIFLMVPLSHNSQYPPTHTDSGLDLRTNLVLANISNATKTKA